MMEFETDIATTDRSMNTFVTHPEEGGPFPVVLFLMDAPGKREELHDMARRLGTVGYYVLLPNLYYRRVREFVREQTQHHGFTFPHRVEHYDKIATERHWERLLALFQRNLGRAA